MAPINKFRMENEIEDERDGVKRGMLDKLIRRYPSQKGVRWKGEGVEREGGGNLIPSQTSIFQK